MDGWWWPLSIVWVAWVVQALLAMLLVRKFARRFARPRRADYDAYRPAAAVIVPFKGIDLNLHDNIARLLAQDYPDYRLIAVVESADDPAAAVVQGELARHPGARAELIVAGPAGEDEGQKVHNLIAAVDHVQRQAMPVEVLVFADSDAAAGRAWLGELVGPLVNERTAVTTGYRWMVPVGERAPTASRFASVINSSVACWAGRDEFNQTWGGSMAMRLSTAEAGDLLGHWRGALSDDYQVTRMSRALGKRVYFVHWCLVATPVEFDWGGFFEFARRQYIITRTHAPLLFAGGLVVSSAYLIGLAATWLSFAWLLLADPAGGAWLLPLLAMIAVFVLNQLRAGYRRKAVRSALGSQMLRRLRTTLVIDRWLTPVWMTLHWAIMVSALFGRTITWRGNRYRIDGPQQIRSLNAMPDPA